MSGIYLTSYEGVPIYVQEDGTFTCTYLGESLKRTALHELKRRIRGREIEPLRFLTSWDVESPRWNKPQHFTALDGNNGKKWGHTDLNFMKEIDTTYHYDEAVMTEAIALERQVDECRQRAKELVKRLRPITYLDLVARARGEAVSNG